MIFSFVFSLDRDVSVQAESLYPAVQITDNQTSDEAPRINNRGDIVWQQKDPQEGDWDIFLSLAGYREPVALTVNKDSDVSPEINDTGQVVWVGFRGRESEIFLFSGGAVNRLTDNLWWDQNPRINRNGVVVWEQRPIGDWEIVRYQDGVTEFVSENFHDDRDPRVNDAGQIVWEVTRGRTPHKVFLYDPQTRSTRTLDWPFRQGRNPECNNAGICVWESRDKGTEELIVSGLTVEGAVDRPSSSHPEQESDVSGDDEYPKAPILRVNLDTRREIFVFDGTKTALLTENRYTDSLPKINDRGDVCWEQSRARGWEVMYCPLGQPEQAVNVSDRPRDDIKSRINNNGWIVWQGYDGHDWEIFVFDGNGRIQLTDNESDDVAPQINDLNQIVWQGFDGRDWEIFLKEMPLAGQTTKGER